MDPQLRTKSLKSYLPNLYSPQQYLTQFSYLQSAPSQRVSLDATTLCQTRAVLIAPGDISTFLQLLSLSILIPTHDHLSAPNTVQVSFQESLPWS